MALVIGAKWRRAMEPEGSLLPGSRATVEFPQAGCSRRRALDSSPGAYASASKQHARPERSTTSLLQGTFIPQHERLALSGRPVEEVEMQRR